MSVKRNVTVPAGSWLSMARIQALARDDYPLAERATASRPTEVTFVRKEGVFHGVAELARRTFSGDPIPPDQWARVFAVFGPNVPDEKELARRRQNRELGPYGMELMCRLDIVDQLS